MVGKDESQEFLQASDIPSQLLPQKWEGDGTMDFDALQHALQQRLRDRYDLEARFTLS